MCAEELDSLQLTLSLIAETETAARLVWHPAVRSRGAHEPPLPQALTLLAVELLALLPLLVIVLDASLTELWVSVSEGGGELRSDRTPAPTLVGCGKRSVHSYVRPDRHSRL